MNKEQKLAFQKFAAQYWGQEVLMYNDSAGDKYWEKQIYPVDAHNITCDLMHLSLRSIGQLTNDELAECARVNWPQDRDRDVDTEWVKRIISTISQNIRVNRYLIGQGICLDETAVKEGWAVIQPDKTVKEDK